VGGGTLKGKVELGIIPNADSGSYLKKYDDAGRDKGIKTLTEGIVISLLQEICTGKNFTVDECVTKSATLAKLLRHRLEGFDDNGNRDNDSTDDITEFGLRIVTCVVKLQKEVVVVQADQNSLITNIMNDRIKARREFYQNEIDRLKILQKQDTTVQVPTLPHDQEIRRELLEEDRNTAGNIREIRGGGSNINVSDFNQEDKGKK
jgi:hypothetical protein